MDTVRHLFLNLQPCCFPQHSHIWRWKPSNIFIPWASSKFPAETSSWSELAANPSPYCSFCSWQRELCIYYTTRAHMEHKAMLLSTAQLSLLHLGPVCVQLLLGFSVDCPVYQSLRANIPQTPQYKNLSEVYKVVCVCVRVHEHVWSVYNCKLCSCVCILYTVQVAKYHSNVM